MLRATKDEKVSNGVLKMVRNLQRETGMMRSTLKMQLSNFSNNFLELVFLGGPIMSVDS